MITDQLRTPNGVEAGAKATFDLDLGNLYRELWLQISCAGGDKLYNEIVGDITLEVNGKAQRTHTAEELNGINILHDVDLAVKTTGDVDDDDLISYLPILLAEDFRKDVPRGLALGWNALGIRSLQLKVQLVAGITSPSLSGWGVWDKADTGRGLGPITKWKRQDLDAVGTPKDFGKVFDVGGNQDNFAQSLHLWPTSTGTVRYATEVELKLNNEIAHKRTFQQNQAVLVSKKMTPDTITPNTPRYDLVFDESDAITDVRNLTQVNKQNLKVTFDGAPNGTMRVISLETGPVE
jgi:hypothetical protein